MQKDSKGVDNTENIQSKKVVLSGNEAIAFGAWAGGVDVVSSYPGTPSTEITEYVSRFKDDIYCEWAVNEKVAMEVSIGGIFCRCSDIHSDEACWAQCGARSAYDLCVSWCVGWDGGCLG